MRHVKFFQADFVFFPNLGNKDILVYNYRGELDDAVIGNVFTADGDGDNDVEDKTYDLQTETDYFV